MSEINPKIMYLLYFAVLFADWGSNQDSGIFANSNKEIAQRFNISNTEVGFLSTGNVYGSIAGIIVSAPLYAHIEPKYVLIGALLIAGIFQSFFAIFSNFWVVYASRILVGFGQSIQQIYYPVWIDLSAPKKYQTIMMALYFCIATVGVLTGYEIVALLKEGPGF